MIYGDRCQSILILCVACVRARVYIAQYHQAVQMFVFVNREYLTYGLLTEDHWKPVCHVFYRNVIFFFRKVAKPLRSMHNEH